MYGGQEQSIQFPIEGAWVGVRLPLMYFNSDWYVVQLIEFSPVRGRRWIRCYNSNINAWEESWTEC